MRSASPGALHRAVDRRHARQAFALDHGGKLASVMWCDTMPATPPVRRRSGQQRVETVRGRTRCRPWPTDDRALAHRCGAAGAGRAAGGRSATLSSAPRRGLFSAAPRRSEFRLRRAAAGLAGAGARRLRRRRCGTPPEGNRRIAALVPGARYEEIANARHFPNVEHPDTFNRIMLGWLEAQRRA